MKKIKILKVKKVIKQNPFTHEKVALEKSRQEFEKEIERHLISTNFKPLDGRTYYGKPIKKIAKVLDFGAYLIACASISLLLVYVAIQWMSI